MIQVGRIDHVTITSCDPERSIAFYRDILGMTIAHEWPGEVTSMQAGETFLAVSWQEKGKTAAKQPPISIHHFALRVDRETFEQAKTWLPENGLKFELEDNGINNSIYIRDPDDHLVELACYEAKNPSDREH